MGKLYISNQIKNRRKIRNTWLFFQRTCFQIRNAIWCYFFLPWRVIWIFYEHSHLQPKYGRSYSEAQSLLKWCPGERVHPLVPPVPWGNKHQVPAADLRLCRISWAGCSAHPWQAQRCSCLWLLQAVLGSREDPS